MLDTLHSRSKYHWFKWCCRRFCDYAYFPFCCCSCATLAEWIPRPLSCNIINSSSCVRGRTLLRGLLWYHWSLLCQRSAPQAKPACTFNSVRALNLSGYYRPRPIILLTFVAQLGLSLDQFAPDCAQISPMPLQNVVRKLVMIIFIGTLWTSVHAGNSEFWRAANFVKHSYHPRPFNSVLQIGVVRRLSSCHRREWLWFVFHEKIFLLCFLIHSQNVMDAVHYHGCNLILGFLYVCQ